MRFRTPSGQTTVEFAFAGIWLVLLMMAVLCFGLITFQKSSFDYQVSHMADELPNGWESMDAKQVVKSCVAASSGLSEDDIEVNSAEIHLEDMSSTDRGNSTAVQLGSELKTTTASYLDISADITVRLGRGIGLAGNGGIPYRRSVKQSFTVERRWEVA